MSWEQIKTTMFRWVRKEVRKHGAELIEEVTNRFDRMIEELSEGISHCETECDQIKSQIHSLTERDNKLCQLIDRAEKISNNLKALVAKE
ncbi:MAG: hypothetical protein JSW11_00925 [Candidatus Heimdallarchaeota archaeon]|nr:MAG: hypothetical protein JSW11_00925 [Candidatus Heimdallarchaeota archaeon]